MVFAVRRVEADYLSPARFDDVLTVATDVLRATPARLELRQDVTRNGAVLFASKVTLVCVSETGAPVRLPQVLRDHIG